ncbi:hypothetical protein ACFLT6_00195 [Chloroflexota bacterium]
MKNSYPNEHDLDKLYKECINLDDFFKDIDLKKHFIRDKECSSKEMYPNFRIWQAYPEDLETDVRTNRGGYMMHIGLDTAGTSEKIDKIAHFIHSKIPAPDRNWAGHEIYTSSIVEEVINGRANWYGLTTYGPDHKVSIRDAVVKNNNYFGNGGEGLIESR